ncbi:stage III sporulation protein AB [Aneurinibacillus soli]|uniref:Stage III sporulation protein SpoAB n=1 Tax=Aneurinibacillus soli TaxID=1500254 RepID=A0A0U4WFA1_9BACL|nr:stage III sporulation protein SpoIIIAB [Aneurinibacillus soli]PYE63651.1 stage III sporulation protein AB [Aneurinibacillus soli]BAU27416.1 stage III sporulation protein SpoAB [Aneurinibacillus soli]
MLKLMGAALIIAASTLIGMLLARRIAKRPTHIRQLRAALTLLETEIVYGATPLQEALGTIAQRVGGEAAGPLFRRAASLLAEEPELSTAECWRQAVQESWSATAMHDAERDVTLQLGAMLGRSDREDQRKHIQLAVINLENEEQTARDNQRRYEKMYRSLGVLGGLLLVILLY